MQTKLLPHFISSMHCMLVSSFVTGSRKVHITFLTVHVGHCAPKCARRDNFLGSRVRKCIHIMHRINISSCHHNEHIVPAFVCYHIPASHFAWVIASSCICVQHTFCSTNCIPFSCSLTHDPCIFLCKTKTKKGKHENSWCILSCIYSVPWANHVGITNPFHLKNKMIEHGT